MLSVTLPNAAIITLSFIAPSSVLLKYATKLPTITTNAPIPVAINANLNTFIATFPANVAIFNAFCAAVCELVAAVCDFWTPSVNTNALIYANVESLVC